MSKLIMRLAGLGLSAFVLLLLVAILKLNHYMDSPLSVPDQGHEYALKKGGSLGTAAHGLARQGLLQNPRWLIIYSRISGEGQSVQAGDYFLQPGLTPRQLIALFESGEVMSFQVTLVEGWTIAQVLAALRGQERMVSTFDQQPATLKPADLGLDLPYPSMEGLLYPDTYQFHSGTSDRELLLRAYQRMQSVLADEWQQRQADLPYKTPYEALTMASIVEKETGDASERAQIAGVFVRRLEKRMRLQTDPAVIYGLGPEFDGNLRRRHLNDASNPYNTYRHHGLTPTPIAQAGRAAINAALHPADGDTLYFVAKGDGSHYFSKTLAEHQRAVRKYQIEQRRKDYSSAPSSQSSI